jgi:hypothetical protein
MDDRLQPPQLSPRLESFLEELLRGQVPNAGRFCGNCYTPLASGREACPECGRSVAEVTPLERLPVSIVDVYIARRRREGLAVRLTFYTILLIGIIASALVIGFLPFWWNVVAFTFCLGASYVLSANLANTFGDSLGYRWGQRAAERKWRQLMSEDSARSEQSVKG